MSEQETCSCCGGPVRLRISGENTNYYEVDHAASFNRFREALLSEETVKAVAARKFPSGTTVNFLLAGRIETEVRNDLEAALQIMDPSEGERR